MANDATGTVLLTGFAPEDEGSAARALASLGRVALPGDPVNDAEAALVLGAAYDERALRGLRAAALGDGRPWAFCVPASERPLVAAAAAAGEGRLLLLPVEGRELRRVLAALGQDARELSSGAAALRGLARLEASFAWRSRELGISDTCRGLARMLADAGFYLGRAAEDECALALEEAFVNAMEHGNLELDSTLRSEDLFNEDRYEEERSRRLADPAYGNRLLKVELAMDGAKAELSIEDEGSGFDASGLGGGPSGLEVSGKGSWLIRRPFDSVSYNDKGNRLTLSKRRPSST